MNYETLRQDMLQGWNAWSTHSVLQHVLLPYGLVIRLMVKDVSANRWLEDALIGRFGEEEEHIHPGLRSYDGTYTELTLRWGPVRLLVQSTVQGGEQHILVSPEGPLPECSEDAPLLGVSCGMLWNMPGCVARTGEGFEARLPGSGGERTVSVYMSGEEVSDPHSGCMNPMRCVLLDRPVAISTGKPCAPDGVRRMLEQARASVEQSAARYGDLAEVYIAMRTCLAWNTIYEPEHRRICSPVSRLWNIGWGGYVLFCCDTYFSALMAMLEDKELAYANVFAITREMTEEGFVPNYAVANDIKSRDRSQPPVGSMVVRELYRAYRERWVLEELFPDLLRWNRWMADNRRREDGTMCWGTNLYTSGPRKYWGFPDLHTAKGAALESGLDNSPLYDDAGFEPERNMMTLADVGFTSLYCMDCEALADIARVLGRPEEAELRERAQQAKEGIASLWDESFGLFVNRDTRSGAFSRRIAPTSFYAGLSDSVTPEQTERMAREHYFNPEEFYGDFVIPSIARNDPAYPEQTYCRGRIWAPTNYLAYLAFRKQGRKDVCADLAQKSEALLLQEWRAHGHVHENYSADDGWGCGVSDSDKFYHWGGLLAIIALMERGYLSGPEEPLEP